MAEMGRPPHVPTNKSRHTVETMAAAGITQEGIARVPQISIDTLAMTVVVDFSLQSSYDFFFDVAIPNFNAFGDDPSNLTAMNAATSLWHMHEWHFNDDIQMRQLPREDYKARLNKHRTDVLFKDIPEIG